MATCSIFHYNKTLPREQRSLILILKDIQTGVYKDQIEKIRALMSQGKKKEAEAKRVAEEKKKDEAEAARVAAAEKKAAEEAARVAAE